MDTDSRKTFSKYPRSLIFILVVAWCALVAFLLSFIYLHQSHENLLIEKNLQTINSYMRSVSGSDSTKVIAAQEIFVDDKNNSFPNQIYCTIYHPDGTISITTANGAQNIDMKNIASLPEAFQEAYKYGLGFNDCYVDPYSKEKSYQAVLFSPEDRCFIMTSISHDNVFVTDFLGKDMMIVNIGFFVIIIILSTYAFLLSRRLNKDLYQLARLSKALIQNSDSSHEEEFHFYSRRIQDIAKYIFLFQKAKNEIIKEHMKEREAAVAEEKEKLKSKRILSNNLNHEVKTPIGIIQGYLETLITHPNINPELQKSFLQKCASNVLRLQNMVYNITMITGIEDGSNSISMEDVNMREAAELVKEDQKFLLQENNLSFSIKISPDVYVISNPSIIYNIINNFLKNSCLYSHGSEIVFETERENEKFYYFAFYDNGVGVAENHLVHMFERFFRIEKAGRVTGGSGLGLAIVKESINLSGGDIKVENRVNGGLKFSFYLPKA